MIKKITFSFLILLPGLNALAQCGTFPKPDKPILVSSTQTICDYSPSPTYTVTNATGTVTWTDNYSTSVGLTYIPSKPWTGYSSKTFYVTQTVNGCASDTTIANLQLITRPNKPATSADQSICVYNKPISFAAVGFGLVTLKWYKNISEIGSSNYETGNTYLASDYSKPLDGGSELITSFFVTQSTIDSNCESPYSELKLYVFPKPLPPTFIGNSSITTCAYNSNVAPLSVNIANGNNYVRWFNNTTGLTITSTDGIVSGISNNLFKPNASILEPNSTIQFNVRQQDARGCLSDTIVGTYNVTGCIELDAFISSFNISIFPNPTSQFIKITANSEMTGKGKLKLFNIAGVLVYEKSLTTVQTIAETISVNMLPNGIYTVVVETENGGKSILVNVQH
jgi:hypothetical protein